jgi:hypothetical protein
VSKDTLWPTAESFEHTETDSINAKAFDLDNNNMANSIYLPHHRKPQKGTTESQLSTMKMMMPLLVILCLEAILNTIYLDQMSMMQLLFLLMSLRMIQMVSAV